MSTKSSTKKSQTKQVTTGKNLKKRKNQWMSECDWQTDRQTDLLRAFTVDHGWGRWWCQNWEFRAEKLSRLQRWGVVCHSSLIHTSEEFLLKWKAVLMKLQLHLFWFGATKNTIKKEKTLHRQNKTTKQNMPQFLLWHLQFSIRTSAGVLIICVQTAIQILPKSKEDEALYR